MLFWIDPRTNPSPPYRGPERVLAGDESEVDGLTAACREGRLYRAEAWIASGQPLQAAPDRRRRHTRVATPLSASIAAGNFDLVRLLLCNGYRTELEHRSPLDEVLEARRGDLMELLLEWGADPARADIGRIFETYQRPVFERFWLAGVDLTAEGEMARTLAYSTRNRPLYGFAKNYRDRDHRIQRALAVALGTAIRGRNDKAVSLCTWAGADPRRRVAEIGQDPANDPDGLTAFEQAIASDAPEYLRKLGFDPTTDDIQPLYEHCYKLDSLRALVSIRPPEDWIPTTQRFLHWLAFHVRHSLYGTSVREVEAVFGLGGRLGVLDRYFKTEVRGLLLALDEWEAKRLFHLLRDPANMSRPAFLDLIAHEKLAARYSSWSWQKGVDRGLWAELAATPSVPAPVRRMARERLASARRVIAQTWLKEGGVERVFTREEIYELVWSEPLLNLARRHGLSDNGLRKRCKGMNIPVPPRGYWQRRRHGRASNRTPLPPLAE